MTKKDYIVIATAVAQAWKEQQTASGRRGVDSCLEHLAHALQIQNPKFNPDIFYAYVQKIATQR